MHKSSMKRMEWFLDNYIDTKVEAKLLDVGSYDVNGSYKELFSDTSIKYTGLDMEEGPNVDIVPKSPYMWEEIENDKYDIVISGQAIEHIEFFWITVGEMVRVTKEDGIICIIAPNGFGEHRYPVDCWRFFTDGMNALTRYYRLEVMHTHTNCSPDINDKEWYSKDCADAMLIARKPYKGDAQIVNLKEYRCVPADHNKLKGNMFSYEEFKKQKEEKNKGSNNHMTKEENTIERIKKKVRGWKKLIGRGNR